MALHHTLEIHRSCCDLLGEAVVIVLNMPRAVKNALGNKIIDGCIDLDLRIRAANMAQDKEPHLLQLLEGLEVIELVLRLCRDKKWISPRQYAALVEHTQSIGRQANGWRRAGSGAVTQQGLFS